MCSDCAIEVYTEVIKYLKEMSDDLKAPPDMGYGTDYVSNMLDVRTFQCNHNTRLRVVMNYEHAVDCHAQKQGYDNFNEMVIALDPTAKRRPLPPRQS